MLTQEIKALNRQLIDRYGRTLDGRPKFKIVWSEDVLEPRYAEVNVYDDNGNFLREEKGIEVRKKWNYIVNRWVICRFFDGPKQQGDVADWDNYEAIFNFDNHGEFLQPTWVACEYICETLLRILPSNSYEEKANAEEEGRKEVEHNKAELEDAGKRFEGETIGYSGKEFRE